MLCDGWSHLSRTTLEYLYSILIEAYAMRGDLLMQVNNAVNGYMHRYATALCGWTEGS